MNTLSRILSISLCASLLILTACDPEYEDNGGDASANDNNTVPNNNGDQNNSGDQGTNTPDNSNSSSGTGGSLSCNNLNGCGGNPVGTWAFANTCLFDETTIEEGSCPGSTLTFVDIDYSGSVATFTDDNTYTVTFRTVFNVKFDLPSSCYDTLEDAQRHCSELQEEFNNSQDEGQSSCNVIDGACICNNTGTNENTEEGEWFTDNSTLFLDSGDGGPLTEFQFCEQGNLVSLEISSAGDIPLAGFILQRQ